MSTTTSDSPEEETTLIYSQTGAKKCGVNSVAPRLLQRDRCDIRFKRTYRDSFLYGQVSRDRLGKAALTTSRPFIMVNSLTLPQEGGKCKDAAQNKFELGEMEICFDDDRQGLPFVTAMLLGCRHKRVFVIYCILEQRHIKADPPMTKP
jgi:hypothetical protein